MSWPTYQRHSGETIWPGWEDLGNGLIRKPDGVLTTEAPPCVPPPGYVMRIIVCGDRNYRHEGKVFAALNKAHRRKPLTLLVHNGNPGAASIATTWALGQGVDREAFRAFEALGAQADADRNARMVAAGADGVIAFPGGRSTADLCMRASAAGIPIWLPYGA